jgi:hypothetical protein
VVGIDELWACPSGAEKHDTTSTRKTAGDKTPDEKLTFMLLNAVMVGTSTKAVQGPNPRPWSGYYFAATGFSQCCAKALANPRAISSAVRLSISLRGTKCTNSPLRYKAKLGDDGG